MGTCGSTERPSALQQGVDWFQGDASACTEQKSSEVLRARMKGFVGIIIEHARMLTKSLHAAGTFMIAFADVRLAAEWAVSCQTLLFR